MKIGAIILGAGLSTRMGTPKLLLPWGGSTVIETIVQTISGSVIEPIVLVSGASHQQLKEKFTGSDVTLAFNPNFANNNMVDSLRVGINAMQQMDMDACLLVLGDQPQIEPDVVTAILEESQNHPGRLIIPSYQMRRGHPWVIPQLLWTEIQTLPEHLTMRDLVEQHRDQIVYLNVQSDSVLADLDTPEEYDRQKPKG